MRTSFCAITFAVITAVFLAGCVVPCTIYTDSRTPPSFGTVKLYGTDNVPFEYREIAVHTVYINTSDQQEAVRIFAEQVRALDADAVLGFRMTPLLWQISFFGFNIIDDMSQYVLSGTVVKIKRP